MNSSDDGLFTEPDCARTRRCLVPRSLVVHEVGSTSLPEDPIGANSGVFSRFLVLVQHTAHPRFLTSKDSHPLLDRQH